MRIVPFPLLALIGIASAATAATGTVEFYLKCTYTGSVKGFVRGKPHSGDPIGEHRIYRFRYASVPSIRSVSPC